MSRQDLDIDLGLTEADEEALAARLLCDAGLNGDAAIPVQPVADMLAEACRMGRAYATATMLGMRTCRVCGCIDTRACDGGCHWVAEDLCSNCAEETVEITDEGLQALVEQMQASPGQGFGA